MCPGFKGSNLHCISSDMTFNSQSPYFYMHFNSRKFNLIAQSLCTELNAYISGSLVSALGLWLFIRRGKQCLDFTVTVHFFHMIGCWIYNSHLPAALSWWLVNVACIALMAVIGEYLCMRTELRAIPVNSGPKSNLWESLLWTESVFGEVLACEYADMHHLACWAVLQC